MPKKYYEKQLIKYKCDSKLLWKTLNKIMNKQEKNRSLPNEFIANDSAERINDPQTIADKFNEYFVNVGPNIAKKIPKSNRTYDQYLTGMYENSFFLEPITKYELQNEINNLNPN